MLLLDDEPDRSPASGLGYGISRGWPRSQPNFGRCQGKKVLSTST
jgi:hypothetical protein